MYGPTPNYLNASYGMPVFCVIAILKKFFFIADVIGILPHSVLSGRINFMLISPKVQP